jgi:hypothetical protein
LLFDGVPLNDTNSLSSISRFLGSFSARLKETSLESRTEHEGKRLTDQVKDSSDVLTSLGRSFSVYAANFLSEGLGSLATRKINKM